MEIYAKRRDIKSVEAMAAKAHTLTRGSGPEWAYICELGRDVDPTNPMYQPGGQPLSKHAGSGHTPDLSASLAGENTSPQMPAPPLAASVSSVDFDLDLDFSANDEPLRTTAVAPMVVSNFAPVPAPALAPTPAPIYPPEPAVAMQAKHEPTFDGFDMDFGSNPKVAYSLPATPQPIDNSLSFNTDLPRVVGQAAPASAPVLVPAPSPVLAPDSGMLEFDMGSISLDLDAPISESPSLTKAVVAAAPAEVEGPLETKLALAEEFRVLGDSDGARSLASEVLAQADGPLKLKAQAFLNALS